MVNFPIGFYVVIYEIEIGHVGTTINPQRVDLRAQPSDGFFDDIIYETVMSWTLTQYNSHIYLKYDSGLILNGYLSFAPSFFYFVVYPLTTSATDAINVRCRFSISNI